MASGYPDNKTLFKERHFTGTRNRRHGIRCFFFEGIEKFLKRYEQLGEYEPDENEIIAGVEQLGVFGHFSTIVSLSRKMGQTYKYIATRPADEIYMTLLYDMEVHAYEKRLADIQRPPANKT